MWFQVVKCILKLLVRCFPDMVKIVTLQGRPKSNRKQIPQLNFDFTVESIGKFDSSVVSKYTQLFFQDTNLYSYGSNRFYFRKDIRILSLDHSVYNWMFEPEFIINYDKYSLESFEQTLQDSCSLKFIGVWYLWKYGLWRTHYWLIQVHMCVCTAPLSTSKSIETMWPISVNHSITYLY